MEKIDIEWVREQAKSVASDELRDGLLSLVQDFECISRVGFSGTLESYINYCFECGSLDTPPINAFLDILRQTGSHIMVDGRKWPFVSREAELEGVVKFLWGIIDDIDTISDVAKSNDVAYRNMVEKKQKTRWDCGITTDGYELDLSNINLPNGFDTRNSQNQ